MTDKIDLEADAENRPITNEKLRQLTSLCELLRDRRAKIIDLEGCLKDARAKEREVSEDKIPVLMDEIGLMKIVLHDSTEISVKGDLKISITNTNRTDVLDFIRKEGDASIIKNAVTILFGKKEEGLADRCYKNLAKTYDNVGRESTVHTGAFKSMVKELRERGVEIPFKKLGIYDYRTTIIKD